MTSETDIRAAEPYGPIELVLSLAAVLMLTMLYGLLLAAVAALGETLLWGFDWSAATFEALREFFAGEKEPSALLLYWIATLAYLLVSAAVFTLARFRGGARWRSLVAWRVEQKWWRSRAYWTLVVAAIVYGFVASALIGKFYPPSKDWFTLEPSPPILAASFIVVVAAGPFTEELLFRGWIYTSLRSRWSGIASVAVSALLFALAHYDPTHLYSLAVFPLGLVLGAIRERSGTIWATIALHSLYNFSGWLAAAFGAG